MSDGVVPISTTSRSYINISLSGGSCQIKGTVFLAVQKILLKKLIKNSINSFKRGKYGHICWNERKYVQEYWFYVNFSQKKIKNWFCEKHDMRTHCTYSEMPITCGNIVYHD